MVVDLKSALTIIFTIIFTTVTTSFGIYFVIESKIEEANVTSAAPLTKAIEDLTTAMSRNTQADRELAAATDSRLDALTISVERLTEVSNTQLMLIKENTRRIDQTLSR